MSKLKVNHWVSATFGEINAKNMNNKLKSMGYSSTEYVFSPGTDFPTHTHSITKMDAIISGQFLFGMYGEEVILQPGDMVEVPKNTQHYARVVGEENVVFFDSTKNSYK